MKDTTIQMATVEVQPRRAKSSKLTNNVPLRRFLRQRSAVAGAIGLGLLVVAALAAQFIAPYGPTITSAENLAPPSLDHLFGTDELGRDIFSRVIFGAQASLAVVFGAPAIALLIGVPLGLVGGYFGGVTDSAVMRLIDLLLAVPGILLALLLVAILGPGWFNLILAIGIGSVPEFARLTRAATLDIRKLDYVSAAKSMGASSADILLRTVLPNAAGVILVQVVITASTAVIAEAGLSFLGLGTQPPTPSWGGMLQAARGYLYFSPLYGLVPGVALVLTVMCLERVGKGLQVAFGTGSLVRTKASS